MSRSDRKLHIDAFDDARLCTLRIDVHVVGDDGAAVPPAEALAARHIVRNVRGLQHLGDYSRPNPPAVLIDAVRTSEIDVAIAWGPLAGFFAANGSPALDVTPAVAANRHHTVALPCRYCAIGAQLPLNLA